MHSRVVIRIDDNYMAGDWVGKYITISPHNGGKPLIGRVIRIETTMEDGKNLFFETGGE